MNPIRNSGRAGALCAAAFALSLLLPAAGSAQTVRTIFLGPTASMVTTFGAPNVFGGYADGYRGVVVTAANLAQFQAAAPPNVVNTYRQLQPGATLRRRIDQVLQISGGVVDVDILLTDDRTGFTGSTGIFVTSTRSGQQYVWPAASSHPKGDGSNRYQGIIRLGETASLVIQAWPGGWLAWEGTILHESLHTQFVGEHTRWGSIGITYGGDASHWIEELLGDEELPFEEGLGTFYGHLHNNPSGINSVQQFLARDDHRYKLESRSVLAGTTEIWNAPHTEVERPVPPNLPQQGRYLIRSYRWRDVPRTYLLFSESTSTAFHLLFWKYANGNPDNALSLINASARSMWNDRQKRFLGYAVNRLSLQLEDYAATPQGQAARAAGTLTSSMFPFALLDILTHFSLTDDEYKREYRRHYPDFDPEAFTHYWGRRNAVKTLVQPHLAANPIRMDQAVAAASTYFRAADTILLPPVSRVPAPRN
jgi:hypothetical protein